METMNRRSWIPWRLRKAVSWLLANRYLLFVLLRFHFKPPKHRILVSSAFFGGVGGVEKLLKAIIESMPDSIFFVVAREVRTEGFLPRTRNYLVNRPPPAGARLDVYLYLAGGGRPQWVGDRYVFTRTMIDPCGADIKDIEDKFDRVAIQTGHAGKYSRQPEKWVPAFPNVRLTFPAAREPVQLPERYLLTVFNPYSDKLKGGDAVFRAADHAQVPIVWCFSDRTDLAFREPADHPNLIKLKNLSQEELYYVYEHALGYVSFSHSESLGLSIAEAFYSGLPIVTREVGFITYIKEQRGVHVYNTEDELFSYLSDLRFDSPNYDYSYLDDNSFEKAIDRLLGNDSRTTTEVA